LLSYPSIRRLSYELFLRGYQALAVLFICSLWWHLPSSTAFPRAYLYITIALFSLSSLTQCGLIAFRNGIITHCRSQANVSHHHGVVRVRIYLEKPVRTQAGQHVNLWIPSVSFWSFTQSHPFVVISWADEPQKTLDLFVEPRHGLTRELLHHAEGSHVSPLLVLFSGPHGWSVAVDEYEGVLMIASGFGIAAQLPYLKRLIHGHNARQVRARRILLVWEICNIGESVPGRGSRLALLTYIRSRTCC
jgi:predicted ferric reductase